LIFFFAPPPRFFPYSFFFLTFILRGVRWSIVQIVGNQLHNVWPGSLRCGFFLFFFPLFFPECHIFPFFSLGSRPTERGTQICKGFCCVPPFFFVIVSLSPFFFFFPLEVEARDNNDALSTSPSPPFFVPLFFFFFFFFLLT